jgi:hypothetical protein
VLTPDTQCFTYKIYLDMCAPKAQVALGGMLIAGAVPGEDSIGEDVGGVESPAHDTAMTNATASIGAPLQKTPDAVGAPLKRQGADGKDKEQKRVKVGAEVPDGMVKSSS